MSVMFVTRLHKAIKNDQGKHPVVLQITWERNVRRKRTGIWARPNQLFVDDDGKARLREIDGKKLKQKKLDLIQRTARRVFEDHYEDEEFDYGEFSRILDETLDLKKEETKDKKMMVGQFSLKVADNFEGSGQVRSAMDYRVLNALILKISPKDIYFSEFTVEWLKQLEAHFNRKGTRGYNYMNLLKVLYNKAVQAKLADYRKIPFKNPYTNPYGYDISKLKKRRIARVNTNRIKDLSIDQIKQLKTYEPRNEKEREYLDAWFFSFYMFGVNLTDLAKLEKRHIKDGRWYYSRSKTGVGLKRGKPIIPEAMEIIERRVKKNRNSKYVFPILHGYDQTELLAAKRINDYASNIRKATVKISKRLEFDGYFTFYSARYSSATIALNQGADRNTVSHLLDHANFSTIDHYVGRADDAKIIDAMEMLRI